MAAAYPESSRSVEEVATHSRRSRRPKAAVGVQLHVVRCLTSGTTPWHLACPEVGSSIVCASHRRRVYARSPKVHWLCLVGVAAWGCGASPEPPVEAASEDATDSGAASAQPPSPIGGPSALSLDSAPLAAHAAGFVELPALDIMLAGMGEAVVPAARLFYRYVAPLDEVAASRLCVVFNGGPGSGATALWLQLGPSSRAPLTRLCHALFIDARAAGLSYQLVADPESYEPSFVEFNAYVDAADHVRALAALLPLLPSELSTVVVVGESYGGVRSTLMLDLLLRPGAPRPFESTDFDVERASLFEAWGSELGDILLAQVLLQPTLAGRLQDDLVGELMRREGSPLRQLASELNHELSVCDERCDGFRWMLDELETMGRSAYDLRASADWLTRHFDELDDYAARTPGLLAELSAAGLPVGLAAESRRRAFRATSGANLPLDASVWLETLGELSPVDRYFTAFNGEVYAHFTSTDAVDLRIDAFESSYGERFLDNLRRVSTFITHAQFDLLNYSPALPAALEQFPSVARVVVDDAQWRVEYAGGDVRQVRVRHYAASHSVALEQSAQLVDDLQAWLSE